MKRVGQYHQFNQKYRSIEPPETHTLIAVRLDLGFSAAALLLIGIAVRVASAVIVHKIVVCSRVSWPAWW
jgi:hypothetical protein